MTNINNKRKIIYEDKTLVLSSFDKESGSAWKRKEKKFCVWGFNFKLNINANLSIVVYLTFL